MRAEAAAVQNGDAWRMLRAGDRLAFNELVRTEGNGSAELQAGDARVLLGPMTEIATSLRETLLKIRVNAGAVRASTRSLNIALEDGSGRVLSSAVDADFGLLVAPDGTAVATTERGSARVSAAGSDIVLVAGKQSVIKKGQAPGAPEPIPASLFLKLADAPAQVVREHSTTLRGQTVKGAIILLQGKPHAVDEAGHFAVPLTLREGKNDIEVRTITAVGNERASTSITVKSKVRVETKVSW